MKLKISSIDKKHIIVMSVSIIAIIISIFNFTYAYFKDTQSSQIVLESASSFGTSTIVKTNVVLEGDLSNTIDKNQGLISKDTLAIKYDDVSNNDYLVSLVAQVDAYNTTFLETEGSSIKYEVYHKTDTSIDTSSYTCTNNSYNDDYCEIGSFENKLDGTPFEMITEYRIKDTNNHYFDVYIYLNNDSIETKKMKVSFFFETLNVEKQMYKEELLKGSDPDLSTGLIPVVYDADNKKDTGWFVADTTKEWYNYNSQWWANAVSVDSTTSEIRSKYVNSDGTYKIGTEINSSDMLAMFVWVPRYSYTIGCSDVNNDGSINTAVTTDDIPTECLGYKVAGASDLAVATPGAIDIKFVSVDDDLETYTGDSPIYTYTSSNRTPSNYYTHPAFDFGGKRLSGLWVGKFEPSVVTTSSCYNSTDSSCGINEEDIRILPNVTSLRSQSIINQFTYSQYLSTNDFYGLNGDSHMMKNNEWSAVAYLSQSKYGKYGNSLYTNENKEIYINNYYDGTTNEGYITGVSAGDYTGAEVSNISYRYNDIMDRASGKGYGGAGASTTGNIYGIYDMSGGAIEFVMGWYNKASSVFGGRTLGSNEQNYSGFTNETKPNDKYFNGFSTTEIYTKNTESIGNLMAETKNWYGDSTANLLATIPWITRGGLYGNLNKTGIFFFGTNTGSGSSAYSFRITLVN